MVEPTTVIFYVSYTIYFSDQAEYDFAVSIAGGTQFLGSPYKASNMFGLTWPPPTEITTKGMFANAPVRFPIIPPGAEIMNPGPTGVIMDPTLDFVGVEPEFPNPPDLPRFRNRATLFKWSGFITKGGSEDVVDPPDPSAVDTIPKRRNIAGFEYPSQADGATNSMAMCRDSSRVFDGVGVALRNDNNKSMQRNTEQYTGSPAAVIWSRFYVRIREYGNTNLDVFKFGSTVVTQAGVRLEIQPTGELVGIANNGFGVFTTVFTTTYQLLDNVWYKIDLILTGGDAVGMALYVNGVLLDSGALAVLGAGNISTPTLGTINTPGNNDWEVDLDDWILAEDPGVNKNGLDFTWGTHIRAFPAIAVTHTDFAGENDVVNQIFNPTVVSASNVQLISTTASAVINALTNFNDGGADDPSGVSFGSVTAVIAAYSKTAGTDDGSLGFSFAGNTTAYTTVSEAGAFTHTTIMALNTGTTTVPDTAMAPLIISYKKSISTDQAVVNALGVSAEYIGAWGIEDAPPEEGATIPATEDRLINLHNCYYPAIAQSATGPQPQAEISACGGTYVGNGTTNTINLPLPPHFIYIRPLKVNTAGSIWFATGFGAHPVGQEQIVPSFAVRVWSDGGDGNFTVIGSSDRVNELGTVYQYIAFCDPSMRYNLCGAFMHDVSVTSYDNNLILDEFQPEAMFANFELFTTSATQRLVYKGLGNSGVTANRIDGTAVTDAASLDEGVLVSKVDLHRQSIQTTYSLWRSVDCSGIAAIQITNYTGDGTGARSITLPHETGRYPLFIYVQPHGSKGFYRDPSHLTTHSSAITDGADSTTAIIGAGIDSISVSTALNVAATDYEVFVIMGDDSGFNNGEFNVQPNPCEWYIDPGDPPGDIAVFAEGGLTIGGNPPIQALRDISGIYTLVEGKKNDTLYDRQTGQTSVDVKIPDPKFRTGYVGG